MCGCNPVKYATLVLFLVCCISVFVLRVTYTVYIEIHVYSVLFSVSVPTSVFVIQLKISTSGICVCVHLTIHLRCLLSTVYCGVTYLCLQNGPKI